jgi:hypothetical protein
VLDQFVKLDLWSDGGRVSVQIIKKFFPCAVLAVTAVLTTAVPASHTSAAQSDAKNAAELAYQSCKSWRLTELAAFNHLIAAYPYSNQPSQTLMAYAGAQNARDTMKRAAALNSGYSKYVTSINKWLPHLFQQYREEKGARETPYNPNLPNGKVFHALCARLGIYSSKPGMRPPIPIIWRYPLSTPTNGARRVCYKLFYISPDQVLYSNDEKFLLRQCDSLALQVASKTDSYSAAYRAMSREVFYGHDSWCWGRNCLGESDFDSVD